MELDPDNYTYDVIYARTLNECINNLAQGYAGTVLPCDLERYFLELVEDEYFFRYPLIRYMYAHMLILGYWVLDDFQTQTCFRKGEDRELAKEILLPMAEAGLAPAQYDIAEWFCFGDGKIEEKAKWILKASKQNYDPAVKCLDDFLALGTREKLSLETLKEICEEVVRNYEGKYPREFALELLGKMQENKIK